MPRAADPPAARPQNVLLHVPRERLLPLESGLSMEWLEPDGLGGYASSTAIGCATRRYHGLLVAATPGHGRRHLFLARHEESLHRPEREFPLSTARYPGTWSPTGYTALESFSLEPWPVFRYRLGRTEAVREVLRVRGAPVVLCRYHVESVHEDITMRIRPLLAFREVDALTYENLQLRPLTSRRGLAVLAQPYPELPPLALSVGGIEARFEADPVWYRRIEYREDLARGYDGHEDQFSPGWFSLRLLPGQEVIVAAGLEAPVEDPVALWHAEAARRRDAATRATGLGGRLALAAEAYPYRTPQGRTGVVAGYPWFFEWGRDTAIALPGLLLARGEVEACGDALEALIPYLRGGLLPNVIGTDVATSRYASADAALWFARAVRLYENASGDRERVTRRFRPALEAIAEACQQGTDLGVRVDAAGLLHVGAPDLNVTWMDAVTRSGPVTPRDGFPVEVNALWFFLLAYAEILADRAGDRTARRRWCAARQAAGGAFLERFWLEREAYLADGWKAGVQDRSVRPGAVIAAALELSPLSKAQRKDVVGRAEAELLTPRGLRTLAPKHVDYVGRYEGDVEARDAAYHQGTVWPWLLGFYVEAWLRAHGSSRRRAAPLRSLMEGFAPHLEEAGLLQVSEVFDGDPPHRPGGAIAQAWSVAELLRAQRMLEDGRP